jgi:O-antigen/teichoic acid export membrane protein
MKAQSVIGAEGQQLIRRVTGTVAVAATVMALATWLLVPTIFGRDFTGVVLPALVLFGATIVYTIASCLSAALLALGNPSGQSRALVVGATASVGSLVGLRSFGATGASFASALGYLVTAIMCFTVLRRDHGFSLRSAVLPNRADVSWGAHSLVRMVSLGRPQGDTT